MGPLVITWEDVANFAPEMGKVLPPEQTAILDAVKRQVPVETWGPTQKYGQTLLAAHIGKLALKRGEGPTTQQSAGQIAISFSSMLSDAVGAGQLGTTSYGVEYQRQIRLLPTVAFGMVT